MTFTQDFRTQLAERRPLIGSWISLMSEEVVEIMARSGQFKWLAIDMEHTGIGPSEMQRLIRIIDLSGVTPIVRVGANDALHIKQALDAGAIGVIVPMVTSKEEAKAAVQAAHYPPRGTRGVGLHRAQGYGQSFDNYRDWMNEGPLVIAQIEHKDGVANLTEIMETDGIDAFFVGPYDLSASFGTPGDFSNPDVAAAMETVDEVVREGTFPGGIHVVQPNVTDLKTRIDAGHCLIAYGVDMIFLSDAVSKASLDIEHLS